MARTADENTLKIIKAVMSKKRAPYNPDNAFQKGDIITIDADENAVFDAVAKDESKPMDENNCSLYVTVHVKRGDKDLGTSRVSLSSLYASVRTDDADGKVVEGKEAVVPYKGATLQPRFKQAFETLASVSRDWANVTGWPKGKSITFTCGEKECAVQTFMSDDDLAKLPEDSNLLKKSPTGKRLYGAYTLKKVVGEF